MNYISAEEFLKQDGIIQDDLSKWWKPQVGDLIQSVEEWDYINDKFYFSPIIMIDKEFLDIFKRTKHDYIPLLQMHHLIQFIEETMQCRLEIDYIGEDLTGLIEQGYYMSLKKIKPDNYRYLPTTWEGLGENLLQALWKVSIGIINNQIREEL